MLDERGFSDRAARVRSSWLKWVCLLVVVLLLGTFVVYVIIRARAAGRAALCNGYICQLGHAVTLYYNQHGALPPAFARDEMERPLHSWRVAVLGFMDLEEYSKYNTSEPWTSPTNRQLLEGPGSALYGCPADKEAVAPGNTSYVAVIGEETFWPGTLSRRILKITPEIEEKILLIEVASAEIPWTEPRDLSFQEAVAAFSVLSHSGRRRHPPGLHYVTFGGKVGFLSSIGSAEEFADMLRLPKGTYEDMDPFDVTSWESDQGYRPRPR